MVRKPIYIKEDIKKNSEKPLKKRMIQQKIIFEF